MECIVRTVYSASAMTLAFGILAGCAIQETSQKTQETTRGKDDVPARDNYVFWVHEMARSDAFRPASLPDIRSCLMSTTAWEWNEDGALPHYVEVEFRAEEDSLYRCWAYIGGCCRETMECFYQATDAVSEKSGTSVQLLPGGTAAVHLFPRIPAATRTHAQHDGPKKPSHWTWLSVPLPRYPSSGIKKVRLLTIHKGFSVGTMVVTTRRWTPRQPPVLPPLDDAPQIIIQGVPLPEEQLLIQADRLWKLDDEKAIAIYKQLLERYRDTYTVYLNRAKIRRRAEQGD